MIITVGKMMMMASAKRKGKRPILDHDVVRPKRSKSTDHIKTNNLSKPQSTKGMVTAKEKDIKVPVGKSRDRVSVTASKGKMIQKDELLNRHDKKIVIKEEEVKSVRKTVSSVDAMDASLQVSLKEPKQLTAQGPTRGSYASPSNTVRLKISKSEIVDGPFICEICAEQKAVHKLFHIKACSHAYCTDCMVKYVAAKLRENITAIRCPVGGCRGLLEPEHCRDMLPRDVFEKWGTALCEAMIPVDQKFYCPFKDCSAMLIDDGIEVIRESECPNCRRLFCAECQVPWHSGIECVKFQKLNKDERDREDVLLLKIAQKKKWQRCPNCRFYVEKKDGCMYMKCRCGAAFCYRCGAASDKTNEQYHYCNVCKA